LAGSVQSATATSPRLWISHGRADPVIPIAEGILAQERLSAAGFQTQFHSIDGLGHSISIEQLQAAEQWLSSLATESVTVAV
jgi:phospholipase/carboxylesterase